MRSSFPHDYHSVWAVCVFVYCYLVVWCAWFSPQTVGVNSLCLHFRLKAWLAIYHHWANTCCVWARRQSWSTVKAALLIRHTGQRISTGIVWHVSNACTTTCQWYMATVCIFLLHAKSQTASIVQQVIARFLMHFYLAMIFLWVLFCICYRVATTHMTKNVAMKDCQEGIDAFFGKRPPRWNKNKKKWAAAPPHRMIPTNLTSAIDSIDEEVTAPVVTHIPWLPANGKYYTWRHQHDWQIASHHSSTLHAQRGHLSTSLTNLAPTLPTFRKTTTSLLNWICPKNFSRCHRQWKCNNKVLSPFISSSYFLFWK